jgi:P-type Cu+ transporter
MTCAACSAAVERALLKTPGVLEASVSLATEEAGVRWDPGQLDPDRLAHVVRRAGYTLMLDPENPAGAPGAETETDPAAPPTPEALIRLEEGRQKAREAEARDLFRRFRVGAVLSVPVVILGHPMWIPGLMHLDHDTLRGLWILSGFLTLPILTWVGGRFFRRGWAAARRGTPTMDTLVAMGTGSAFVYSVLAVAVPDWFPEGTAFPFFEAVAVILTLVLLGQALEARARGATGEAIRSLLDLTPPIARRIVKGEEVEVPLAEVQVGMRLAVRPGERVPVDGVILEGSTAVDESMVTGESIPVDRGPGAPVIGGTLNTWGAFRMGAERVGRETLLARIVAQVREAQGSKPPLQRLADRVSAVFVPTVLVIALVTFVVWLIWGPPPTLNFAAVVAVSVLVIACPCALGLATPISVMIAVGNAARHGILIRSGEALQAARDIDTVVLDKTGTITEGRPRLVRVLPMDGESEARLLRMAGAVESGSEHPLARAVVEAAWDRGLTLPKAENVVALPGLGVEGWVGGERVRVGNAACLSEAGIPVNSLEDAWSQLASEGQTPAMVAVGDRPLGLLAWEDEEKPDSAEAIARLHAMGLEVHLLSGDDPRTAVAVARRVGIPADRVHAGVRPDGKARMVEALHRDHGRRVAMVGDGVNDAPALAQAQVGMAMGTGTDVALQAAGMTLMGGSLHGVANAIALSRAAVRNMKQNLFGAFLYNTAAIPVAAGVLYPAFGVLLSPMIAGGAMAMSSVTVVMNANRLRRWRPPSLKAKASAQSP